MRVQEPYRPAGACPRVCVTGWMGGTSRWSRCVLKGHGRCLSSCHARVTGTVPVLVSRTVPVLVSLRAGGCWREGGVASLATPVTGAHPVFDARRDRGGAGPEPGDAYQEKGLERCNPRARSSPDERWVQGSPVTPC